MVLQDEVIAKMKTGSIAMFIIFDTPEAGIGIPVSLQGFGDALGQPEIAAVSGAKKSAAEKEKSAADTSVFGGRTSVPPCRVAEGTVTCPPIWLAEGRFQN